MSSEPLCAHSLVEACLYFMATPCAVCGHGALSVSDVGADKQPGVVGITATCGNCGVVETHRFRLLAEMGEGGQGADVGSPEQISRQLSKPDPLSAGEAINATADASQLIDAVQWVTLARVMLEGAEETPAPVEQRWRRIRAAQCLDEALKFYDAENELPPAEALFVESSREAVRQHPQRYARSRLMSQRGALPADGLTARMMNSDAARSERKPWWRFW